MFLLYLKSLITFDLFKTCDNIDNDNEIDKNAFNSGIYLILFKKFFISLFIFNIFSFFNTWKALIGLLQNVHYYKKEICQC